MVALLPRPLEAHSVVTVEGEGGTDDVIFVFGGYNGITVTDEVRERGAEEGLGFTRSAQNEDIYA